MNKSIKNLLVTFFIGTIVFIIGNLIDGGFNFETVNEGLVNFGFYQLYSFVLGY